MFEPLVDGDHLQHFLFLLEFQRQVRDDGVGEPAALVDARQRGKDFRRNLLVQLDVLVELGQQGATHGLDLDRFLAFGRENLRARGQMRPRVGDLQHARALVALDQHLDGAVGQFQHLQHGGDAAGAIQVFRRRIVLGGGFLRDQQDALAGFHRGFQRLDGLRAAHEQRDHHVREDHHVTERQQWQVDLFLEGVVAHVGFLIGVERRTRKNSVHAVRYEVQELEIKGGRRFAAPFCGLAAPRKRHRGLMRRPARSCRPAAPPFGTTGARQAMMKGLRPRRPAAGRPGRSRSTAACLRPRSGYCPPRPC